MAYVHKLIEKDEDLAGIATLHWIYLVKGIAWFFGFAGVGWLFDSLMTRGLWAISDITGSVAMPAALMGLTNLTLMFFLGIGFLIFFFHVITVISTNIALTNRRIIYKRGLLFVKVEQIDIEEIRGENLDLGWFGRLLGYAYISLDCRFIGDVKLPAMERPERFIRALHHIRANAQDTVSMVVGKGEPRAPLNIIRQEELTQHAEGSGGQQTDNPNKEPVRPEVEPPQQPAQPEIIPPQQPGEIPTPPNEPMPQQPPPLDRDQQAARPQAQEQAAFYNDRQKMIDQESNVPDVPETKGQVQKKARQKEEAAQIVEKIRAEIRQPDESPMQTEPARISPEVVEQVVRQVTPQLAKEVVHQLEEQGLISHPEPPGGVDNNLIHVFDDAALTKDGKKHGPDNQDRLGYVIH